MNKVSEGIEAPVRLDSLRGGWLTPDEAVVWDEFQTMDFGGLINESDVVAVFGAAGGGIAAYVRQYHPAHLILVEDSRANRHLLEMSWRGARGVSIMDRDPVEALSVIITNHQPSVAILNLGGRETEPAVIAALAQPNESLDLLCVRYRRMNERARALDDVIRTWHDGELRWSTREHNGPLVTQLYVR
jgi:hypothetical protein